MRHAPRPRRLKRDTHAEHRELAALAGPIAVTQLAHVMLTTVDLVMLGALGLVELAAGGLAIVVFHQFRGMAVGFVTATKNQVAAVAAREPAGTDGADGRADQLRDLVRAGFALGTAGAVVGGALMVATGYGLRWLGQDAEVTALARDMLIALGIGLLPCLWFQVLRQYTIGMRRPRALAAITLAAIALNAALSALLAFVLDLGVIGIGAATGVVYLCMVGMLLIAVRRDPVLAGSVSLRGWKAEPATLRRLAHLGWPIAGSYGSESVLFTVVALMMGGLGTAALAAHHAVNQLIYLVFQLSAGVSHAASILVSGAFVNGRLGAARRIAGRALLQGAAVAAVAGGAYLAAPELVLRPFLDSDDPVALTVAADLLLIAIVLQFVDSAQNIGVGLLRGLDDTRSGLYATLVGYWLVGLPAIWLFAFGVDGGAKGIWWGLVAGLAATAALLLGRYARATSLSATGHWNAPRGHDPCRRFRAAGTLSRGARRRGSW